MSLPTLDISIEATNKGFIVTDNTRKYSRSNTDGWMPGQYSISNVTSSRLRITLPNGSQVEVDVKAYMPADDCVSKEVLFQDIGLSEPVSGRFTIEYIIVVGDEVLREVRSLYHLTAIKCCIEKKLASATDFDSDTYKQALFMSGMLNALSYAICEGNLTDADALIEYMSSKCNCKCC